MRTNRAGAGDGAQTRSAILDATARIMRAEGYAAVSSRRVAEAAGLKSQLVYYHFGTMDELFLALYRREEERYFAAHARALAQPNPLRALWRLNVENIGSDMAMEFFALANHRKVIAREIAASTKRYHSLQSAVLARFLEDRGVSAETMPAGLLSFLLGAISRALVSEASIGFDEDHDTVLTYVERWLSELERGVAAVEPARG